MLPGWQHAAALATFTSFRERELLPSLPVSCQALLRSQNGPQAAAWLHAIPTDPATTMAPRLMHIALRRRLRWRLPLLQTYCGAGPQARGCGLTLDAQGDHAVACPRTGLLARRAVVLEHAWVRVAREAVGPEGRVVPQQWLTTTAAPGVHSDDRRRLDLVVHGATAMGHALLRPQKANICTSGT